MFGQLQSIATGHMNVNDNYVGINRVEKNNAVGSTRCLPYYLEVLACLQ